MEIQLGSSPSTGSYIIEKAQSVGLDPKVLYEAVIDLSAEGLFTAGCINLAAGILLEDLGLPNYFFVNIRKESLGYLLRSIATSIKLIGGRVALYGRVAHVDFDLEETNNLQRVRIATAETRDSMEKMLEEQISGHRREYYYSPASNYYTYIIRPETVRDFPAEDFAQSRFLFNLAGDYAVTPLPTRKRYENFLAAHDQSVTPLIQVFNLPETGETRIMFNSDFETPQLPILRKLLSDHGLTLLRGYWEPYLAKGEVSSSVCTLYVQGELSRKQENAVTRDLIAFLSFAVNSINSFYIEGKLHFHEMLFAGNAIDFTHLFIFKESENITDRDILNSLTGKDQKDAFAKRIQGSNKAIYGATLIENTAKKNIDLIKYLYSLFEKRFKPGLAMRLTDVELQAAWIEFEKIIAGRFMDFSLGYDIFKFMFKMVSCTLKTNFYKPEKRSYAFRFDNDILDPLVFDRFVYGIFYVNGHYSNGTHLRAEDISRGGLRLIRVSRSNYDTELDNVVLLNYALGPKAQRLKHKDICESGSKGVVIPYPQYAKYSVEALYDYTEGIMDLMLLDDSIVDYHGKQEMVFFGPDEGTAPLMDGVAIRARERGYNYWRTITTGKSTGIPHDTYGLLESGELFGLFDRGKEGVELQIAGKSILLTNDMEDIHAEIGGKITTSGMTTTCIMSSFRTLIQHYQAREEQLNLMMTGGPDGDLGANEIQCYKGKICLIVDGGSVLYDPDGLDKKELMKIAFRRNSNPRSNSLAFDEAKLGPHGFKVILSAKNITLPDGSFIEDGGMFHRHFLSSKENRRFIKQADIQAFIPCGGFKDTINSNNIKSFLAIFQELKFIVEGANVFFDDASRRYIATHTAIKQIKDSTANKGGVFSSSIAEVLTAFLLQDDYEASLLNDTTTRWALIRDIIDLVDRYSCLETDILLRLHDLHPEIPLFDLSEKSSEQIFTLQDHLNSRLDEIAADEELVWAVMKSYIPPTLVEKLGRKTIMTILNSAELQNYRNAILGKKIASMAFYRFGLEWDAYLQKVSTDFFASLHEAFLEE
jgi:glutamate dehydrogenase